MLRREAPLHEAGRANAGWSRLRGNPRWSAEL